MIEHQLALSLFGAFLISVGRILGEYISEMRYKTYDIEFGFDSQQPGKSKMSGIKLYVFSTLATVIYGVGWDLFLTYDNDKYVLIAIAIPLATTLAQFQDVSSFFKDEYIFSNFFQLLIWVSWVLFLAFKEEFLLMRWFGFASIFISNVYYNVIRERTNIYKSLFNMCFDEVELETHFHFAFHFQLFGYVLLAAASNF